jgi:threonine/homoserine/homoserine lactone efflux protein
MILIGFIIGFLGYLPPGNINLTAVQLGLSESAKRLWAFILFAAFMEFVYCYGSLLGMNFLLQQPHWINVLKWSAVAVFLLLGGLSLLPVKEGIESKYAGIRKGVLIAIFNPLQIPFWLVWGVYVMQNNWVEANQWSMGLFSFITATGTIAVLWMYAVAGKRLVEKLNINRALLNRIIGVLLITLAILQAIKLLRE